MKKENELKSSKNIEKFLEKLTQEFFNQGLFITEIFYLGASEYNIEKDGLKIIDRKYAKKYFEESLWDKIKSFSKR